MAADSRLYKSIKITVKVFNVWSLVIREFEINAVYMQTKTFFRRLQKVN